MLTLPAIYSKDMRTKLNTFVSRAFKFVDIRVRADTEGAKVVLCPILVRGRASQERQWGACMGVYFEKIVTMDTSNNQELGFGTLSQAPSNCKAVTVTANIVL